MALFMKILGIITARGGSKSVPRKNIKELGGKPLIAYTIEAAKKSGVLDRLILSTDDAEIAEVGKRFGAEVPFMRPAEFAQDTTPTLPVLQQAVKWLKENEDYSPTHIMILQPTSPFRQPFHIREAVELLERSGADSVLSVSEIPEHYSSHKAMIINQENFLTLINGSPVRKRIPRKQDLPKVYWSIGSIYLFKTELLFDSVEPNFYGDKVAPYIIDKKYVVDIDGPEDWELAEIAIKRIGRKPE